jgi:hypothetical protein
MKSIAEMVPGARLVVDEVAVPPAVCAINGSKLAQVAIATTAAEIACLDRLGVSTRSRARIAEKLPLATENGC